MKQRWGLVPSPEGTGLPAQGIPVGMCPCTSLAQARDKHLFLVRFILP